MAGRVGFCWIWGAVGWQDGRMKTSWRIIRVLAAAGAAWAVAGCGRGPDGDYAGGCADLESGLLVRGTARLERALEGAPDAEWAGDAWNRLGLVYAREGRDEDAAAAFGHALEAMPGNAAAAYNAGIMALKAKDGQKGLTLLQKAKELDAGDVRAQLAIGEWTTKKGRLDLAQRMYFAALKRDERNAAAMTGLGRIALLKEERAQAEGYFMNALECRKDYPPALYNLGVLHSMKGGDPEKAKEYFRQYLAADPKGERAEAAAGRLEGRAVEQTSFREGEETGPDRKVGLEWAAAQQARNRGDTEEAVEHVLRAMATAREGGKRNPQRADIVKRATSMFGDRAAVQVEAGEYYLETDDPAAALAAFTKAQAADPKNPLVLLGLSRAATAMEEFDTAVLSLRKLIELEPKNTDARWALAELYGELGMWTKGEAAFREFAAEFPTDPRAGEVARRIEKLGQDRKAAAETEE